MIRPVRGRGRVVRKRVYCERPRALKTRTPPRLFIIEQVLTNSTGAGSGKCGATRALPTSVFRRTCELLCLGVPLRRRRRRSRSVTGRWLLSRRDVALRLRRVECARVRSCLAVPLLQARGSRRTSPSRWRSSVRHAHRRDGDVRRNAPSSRRSAHVIIAVVVVVESKAERRGRECIVVRVRERPLKTRARGTAGRLARERCARARRSRSGASRAGRVFGRASSWRDARSARASAVDGRRCPTSRNAHHRGGVRAASLGAGRTSARGASR